MDNYLQNNLKQQKTNKIKAIKCVGCLPRSLRLESLAWWLVSYPHFGPKNTRSNFLYVSDYFKFTMSLSQFSTVLQTHILLFLSPIFLHLKPPKVFFLHCKSLKKVSKTMAYFATFYSNFFHKIIQKGILVISYKGTHFSPCICPRVFSTCLHESLVKFCPKIILVLHLSQLESV